MIPDSKEKVACGIPGLDPSESCLEFTITLMKILALNGMTQPK